MRNNKSSRPQTRNPKPQTLIMGTRGSPLALAQSRLVAAALQEAHPGLTIEERVIRTTGDKLQGAALPEIGGKGVFTLEIEHALLQGQIDFAVHSLKDLPPELPAGLCIGAIPKRETACDVCILHPDWQDWPPADSKLAALPFLPHGARLGTSSLRRSAQLLHLRSDLVIESIRGNIDTRLRKLEEQNFHAIILARAGLQRLQVEVATERQRRLNERDFVPAPGQGALAIEARADNKKTLRILKAIDHEATRAEITAERTAMRALNAGCSTPLGARALAVAGSLELWAAVLSPDGAQHVFAEDCGAVSDAQALGEQVAQQLLAQGANRLLENSATP
ncbi:MAG: hydroxymethylbilane synthase [Abitibacteriaceae bacterium]|nr:hydroxymethylbilane synthase [Abditibacteriaceae bacterium]